MCHTMQTLSYFEKYTCNFALCPLWNNTSVCRYFRVWEGLEVVILVVLVVELWISVDQLHENNLCTLIPKTLYFNLFSHLLEGWTAGMHHIIVFLNNGILFHQSYLQNIFLHIFLRNNLIKIIPSYPKPNIAKISVCFIVHVSLLLFNLHTKLKWRWKLIFQSVKPSYTLQIIIHISAKNENYIPFFVILSKST